MEEDIQHLGPVLKQGLAQKDLELKGFSKMSDDTLQVNADKLYQVGDHNNQPVYMAFPATVQVKLDAAGNIASMEGDTASPAQQASARSTYDNLLSQNQIEGLTPKSQGLQTHRLETNEQGQQIVRRARFSSY